MSNISFSPLIVGCMRLGVWGAQMSTSEYEKFIDACLDMGLKDFDHADIYGHYTTEAEFGEVIKKRPDLKSKIQVTTKCGIKLLTPNRPEIKVHSYDSTKDYIIWSAENSLKLLGLDHIDLLLIHRPDYLMDPAEIAEAFEQLKAEGKVKHFGVSNFTTSQFELLNSYTPLVTNQVEVSLLHRDAFDNGTLDQCLRHKIQPTAWSPFGGGRVFNDSNDEQIIRVRQKSEEIAERYDTTIDQILLAWIMKHPSDIIPVLGSSKTARIASALEATQITLTHEEWYDLWQAATGVDIP